MNELPRRRIPDGAGSMRGFFTKGRCGREILLCWNRTT